MSDFARSYIVNGRKHNLKALSMSIADELFQFANAAGEQLIHLRAKAGSGRKRAA